jgi:hypothetical protein
MWADTLRADIEEMFAALVVPFDPREDNGLRFIHPRTDRVRTQKDRARTRAWRRANPEKHREINREHNQQYRQLHRERILAERRAWRAANRDKINKRKRELYQLRKES